jgi:hypothetical protein
MSESASTFAAVKGEDSQRDPVRLLVVQGEARPPVDATTEPMVMTVPHLLLRELITLLAASLALVLISLIFNAPLEEIANPEKTPNPAKAPWYFLGLQELLHYYPPVIAGVIIPTLVIFALIIVPYFDVNLKRKSLFEANSGRTMAYWWTAMILVSLLFLLSGKHPVWPIAGCVWAVALLASFGAAPKTWGALGRWSAKKSLAYWVFYWFLLTTTALTIIGTLFRGPGWSLTLPWRDGIY